ncbi:SpoIID/LytB domain-containing protein [Paenibacillus sp.]|uniref:SpoIID/LytB domain-containing protein n=1 Tax=Paenibacillus sp. TaxID=58172 RepID=UPI002D44FF3D|nr:SpoIID/LytB domain-containing protein [Paenibacillus sp.]HZG84255.1 SpoIID/LytB domain-containing protein [Paenibacillus sp.]
MIDIRSAYRIAALAAVILAVGVASLAVRHDSEVRRYRPYSAAANISVKLINYLGNVAELQLNVVGSCTVNGMAAPANASYRLRAENGEIAVYEGAARVMAAPSVTFAPTVYGTSNYVVLNQRPYLGTVVCRAEGGFVRPVNTLPLEDYLKGVVPYEMPDFWPLEALKVQAVAARTYAAARSRSVIDDSINYQVYAGYRWQPNATRAVNETRGRLLMYRDALAETLYSASNGGLTESNANVWGGDPLPYLPIQSDPYDPVLPWSFRIRKTQIDLTGRDLSNPDAWWAEAKEADPTIAANLKTWLVRNGYASGDVKIVSVPELSVSDVRTSGGRAIRGSIAVTFVMKGSRDETGALRLHEVRFQDATAQRIRAMIGASLIRSYLIDPVASDDTAFTMSGRGFGHAVGMSQEGTRRMAEAGFGFEEILSFYYPGTALTAAQEAPPPENISPQEPEAPPEEPPAPEPAVEERPLRDITLTIGSRRALVDGTAVSMLEAPYIEGGRTMLPLRFIGEHLGARVDWDGEARTIAISEEGLSIVLRPDNTAVAVNGETRRIDVPPRIVRGVTFVPIRFVTEQLNGTADWNDAARTVRVRRRLAP